MIKNYYYITTGQHRNKEIYDFTKKKMHSYSEKGNKMYVLHYAFTEINGVRKDWFVTNLSKNIEVAIEKAKKYKKEKGYLSAELVINSDYPEVDDNEKKPQWVRDIEASNKIYKIERTKKRQAEKVKRDKEKEERVAKQDQLNKKLITDLSKSTFVGQPKDKLEKKLTIVNWNTKKVAPYCGYGDDVTMNIVTLEDKEKNIYTYFGGVDIGTVKENDLETRDEKQNIINYVNPKDRVGNTYVVKFTVKKHNTYIPKNLEKYNFDGVKQNIIQRPKVFA